jgi:hypothetical protein
VRSVLTGLSVTDEGSASCSRTIKVKVEVSSTVAASANGSRQRLKADPVFALGGDAVSRAAARIRASSPAEGCSVADAL